MSLFAVRRRFRSRAAGTAPRPTRRGRTPALIAGVAVIAAAVALALVQSSARAAGAATQVNGGSAACDQFTISLLGIIDITSFPEPGWVWVDPSQKFKDVSGKVTESFVTHTDFPAVHDSHDQNTKIMVDPGFEGLLSDANDPGILEMEWEIGTFPSETSGDPPERTFPRWAWPSAGDRVWLNGNWIFDCGHPADVGGANHYHTEIHPPRAIATMRDQLHTLPGTGTTPVRVTKTDLYIHGRAGFVGDDLACGQGIIVSTGTCTPSPYPHRGTPIDADYHFDICLPPKPFPSAVLATSMQNGPGNTLGTDPVLTPQPAAGACTDPAFGPTQLHVDVPLDGTGATEDDVLARQIYAGWVFPPEGLRHVKLTLTKGVLHNDMEFLGDCECSFFWLNVDRDGNSWYRLTPYEIPTSNGDLCGTNTLNDWGDDSFPCNGELNFSGPTFDFYVAKGMDYTLRTVAYDQDCLDDRFGNFILADPFPVPTLDALALGACFIPPENGDNDSYDPAAATNLPAGSDVTVSNPPGDFDLHFNVTNEAVTIEDTADLSLIKACKPDLSPALAGQQITCTIVVSNPGPGLPSNVVVSDTLLTNVAPTDYTMDTPSFTFSGGGSPSPCTSPVDIAGGKQFQCNLGTVPVGGSAIVSYHITSNEGGDFNNFTAVTTSSTDPNPNNNSDRSSVHVDSVSDLNVTKTAPVSVVAGTPITWSLSLANGGPSNAGNVVVTDTVPAGVVITSVTGSGGASCTTGVAGDPNQPATCNYGSLPSSATRTMTVNANVLSSTKGSLKNNARISSDTFDSSNANNVATSTTAVTQSADLAIGLTSDPTPAQGYKPSTTIHYKVTVNNLGPSDADAVVVTIALPPQKMGFYVKDDGGCTLSNATLTCPLGTFVAGSPTRTIFVDWFVQGNKGQITTTASVASATPDPVAANNSASVTLNKA
jgi:uncharacterized repeat protein (TIGR01451 family)